LYLVSCISPQDYSKGFTIYTPTDQFNRTPFPLLCETFSHGLNLDANNMHTQIRITVSIQVLSGTTD